MPINISKALVQIRKEIFDKKPERDEELQNALEEILEEISMDGFDTDSLSITPLKYGHHRWDEQSLTNDEKIQEIKLAVVAMDKLCDQLKQYGFKSATISNYGYVSGSKNLWFQIPYISVDLK